MGGVTKREIRNFLDNDIDFDTAQIFMDKLSDNQIIRCADTKCECGGRGIYREGYRTLICDCVDLEKLL